MVATCAGVAAGLGALGHHDVAAGLDGGDGVADLAAHVHDQHVAGVAELDDVAGDAEPGDEHPAAAVDDRLDLGLHVTGHGGEQVDAEGLVGERAHGGDLVDHPVEAHGGGAHAAEAAGLADTAATSSWYDTPPMPASITGCSISRMSVSRVRMPGS